MGSTRLGLASVVDGPAGAAQGATGGIFVLGEVHFQARLPVPSRCGAGGNAVAVLGRSTHLATILQPRGMNNARHLLTIRRPVGTIQPGRQPGDSFATRTPQRRGAILMVPAQQLARARLERMQPHA